MKGWRRAGHQVDAIGDDAWCDLFGLFAESRTDDVLRLWAQGVAKGEITWDGYVYTLVKLPADALQAYPEALAALRAYEKRRR